MSCEGEIDFTVFFRSRQMTADFNSVVLWYRNATCNDSFSPVLLLLLLRFCTMEFLLAEALVLLLVYWLGVTAAVT